MSTADDLAARSSAAQALNKLGHAVVGRRLDPTALARVEAFATEVLDLVEHAGPTRHRRQELTDTVEFMKAMSKRDLGVMIEQGAFMDMFSDSPVSGSANPMSMGVQFGREGDEVVGRVVLQDAWEGAPGRAHGGVVSAIMDETMGGLLPIVGTMAFTGRLTIKYRAPCPLHHLLEFRARLQRREGRKLYIEGEGTVGGDVFAEAEGLFIAIDLNDF